jgi:hypothetical protein
MRPWLLALACAAIAVAVFAARPKPTPGPFLRDFEAYWAAGSAWNVHADPYGRAIWRAERNVPGVDTRHDEVLPFVGPPATLLVWGPVARIPYAGAAALWTAILVAFLLLLVAAAVYCSGAAIEPWSFLGALALALAFGPVTSDLALGQIAVPAFVGAILVTLVAARSIPAATAAACLAFFQPNVSLGLSSQLGRRRILLALVLATLITYALGAVTAGLTWPLTYARVLAEHGASEQFDAIQIGPAAIAYAFGAAPHTSQLIGAGVALLAIVTAILIAFRVRDVFARFAAFSALAPFAAGFFHEHDLVVAYAAAAWCALRTRATTRTIALAGTLLVAVDWLGLAQRPIGIVQSALLATAALAAFSALGNPSELRRALVAAPAFAALFAAAAWLGIHHPAPVWPDALGAFRAPAGASIAAIWIAEQRASGLLAAVPSWALLRSLSLLGCGLLAYAIYRHPSCCRTA